MSRREKTPTLAEHQQVGHCLKAASDLLTMAIGLLDTVERKNGLHSKQLKLKRSELLAIRSEREDQLHRQHPELSELEKLNAYFGSRDRDAIAKIANSDGQDELRALRETQSQYQSRQK